MKSQIPKKKKERKREWWNCGIPTIFQKKASHEGTKNFLGKKIMGRF